MSECANGVENHSNTTNVKVKHVNVANARDGLTNSNTTNVKVKHLIKSTPVLKG